MGKDLERSIGTAGDVLLDLRRREYLKETPLIDEMTRLSEGKADESLADPLDEGLNLRESLVDVRDLSVETIESLGEIDVGPRDVLSDEVLECSFVSLTLTEETDPGEVLLDESKVLVSVGKEDVLLQSILKTFLLREWRDQGELALSPGANPRRAAKKGRMSLEKSFTRSANMSARASSRGVFPARPEGTLSRDSPGKHSHRTVFQGIGGCS